MIATLHWGVWEVRLLRNASKVGKDGAVRRVGSAKLLAGDDDEALRLEDIELQRNDEAFLDGLAQRIADPTTSGDFTRRFEEHDILDFKGYENKVLIAEDMIEYQPRKCSRPYRLVIVRKNISVQKGERALFDEIRYFFYITNRDDYALEQIVSLANGR